MLCNPRKVKLPLKHFRKSFKKLASWRCNEVPMIWFLLCHFILLEIITMCACMYIIIFRNFSSFCSWSCDFFNVFWINIIKPNIILTCCITPVVMNIDRNWTINYLYNLGLSRVSKKTPDVFKKIHFVLKTQELGAVQELWIAFNFI